MSGRLHSSSAGHVADLLDTIVGAARHTAEARERLVPIDALRQQITRQPRGEAFHRALRSSAAPRVIAECKRRSPSKGILRNDYDAAAHARSYVDAGAAAISVLTEPTFFDGSLDHLSAVRAVVDVPLLRKDFVVTEYQLVEAVVRGADAVLLIVGALDDGRLRTLQREATELGLAALVEYTISTSWIARRTLAPRSSASTAAICAPSRSISLCSITWSPPCRPA